MIDFCYLAAVIVGLLSEIGDPARQALIADILPEEKRAEGFGVYRVIHNLAWIIGPSVGGFLAGRSYIYLFITDAVLSTITALIVLRWVSDAEPDPDAESEVQSLKKIFIGYRDVLKDKIFVAYLLVAIMMLLVYQQPYSTFSVFLRDYRGFPESSFGIMMSTNAAIVVVFQFWISRKVGKKNPFLMMALGTAFYLAGYTAFGHVHAFYLILLAVIVITIGEMIMVPVQMAITAKLSPPEMRGRYMAASNLSWSIPAVAGLLRQ
jgi:MFS family permease